MGFEGTLRVAIMSSRLYDLQMIALELWSLCIPFIILKVIIHGIFAAKRWVQSIIHAHGSICKSTFYPMPSPGSVFPL
jgi:hypothetical protein